jgi:peptidoglycan lytic transglycosylase G
VTTTLDTLAQRSGRPERGSRRRGLIVLLAFVLVMVGLAVAAGGYYEWAVGASGPQRPVSITIPSGATGSDVANLLKKEGVIRSTLGFRLLAKVRHFSSGFEAGRYNLKTNMPVSNVLDALKAGPVVQSLRVTFPEGYRLSQMAQRVKDKLGIKSSTFTKSADSGRWTLDPYLPAGTNTVEGFLFPSTYDFLKDSKATDVIQRLLQEFDKQAKTLSWTNAKALGVTDYEVVVIASLIEREARFDADRPKIAAVIYNRLKKGMPLEIDATIQYALGSWAPITIPDRQVDSPYNTYLHAGLPPTPIASPGLASLTAALNPAKANYLYYVVIDAAGHHGFTNSYAEFVKLKNKYKG